MASILKYIILTSLRERSFQGLLLAILSATLTAAFLGQTLVIEQSHASITFVAFSLRLVFDLGVLIFCTLSTRRIFDSGEGQFILALNISRMKFVFSIWAGFFGIIFILAFSIGLVLLVLSSNSLPGLALWILSLMGEGIILSATSLFFALSFQTTLALLASLGFYVFARLGGSFLAIANSPWREHGSFNVFLDSVLNGMSALIPRLDLFAETSWLFGALPDTIFIVIQTVGFSGLFIGAACYDFAKRTL